MDDGWSSHFPGDYQPLDGCEGQPYCLQDERCLGGLVAQFCPEIAASDIADLDRETVVVIGYNGGCIPEICSARRCPGELTLSVQPEWCSALDWARAAATMIVIPKTDREEIALLCYDGLRGRCEWGEPSSTELDAAPALDAAWGAFRSWTSGWAKLPASLAEERDKAQKILGDLFEDGLRFTQLAWHQEWAESSARLQRLVDKGHEAVVGQLGGNQFLGALRAAHEAYGEALGITAGQPEPEPVPQIRKALESFRAALRT